MSKILPILLLAAGGLTGCVDARSLNPQFGEAYQQHIAAQVADPDAVYTGDPDPGSNGSRVGLAQTRYQKGTVIKPAPATASPIGIGTTGGNQAGAAPPQ